MQLQWGKWAQGGSVVPRGSEANSNCGLTQALGELWQGEGLSPFHSESLSYRTWLSDD